MRLDVALDRAASGLEPRERAFAQEVAYGTVRFQARLDHLLAPHVRRGLDSLDGEVHRVLRTGLYQLLYLDVPDYAAVSQAVDATRAAGQGRAAGMVNAVLRRAGERGEDRSAFPDRASDPEGYLAAWGSHPRWLVSRWLARWPLEEVERLVEADNRRPELHLVPVDGNLDGARTALEAEGAEVELLPLPGLVRIRGLDPRRALEIVPGFIQDPGAALVCRYAAAPPGALVADLCAAPGGKALSLARSARYLLAADPSGARTRILLENVRRLGLPIGVVRARAEEPPLRQPGQGGSGSPGLTLLDVPCTGTGTLRRHPDARWRLGPGSVAELAAVQARMLREASAVVPPGGLLVYSTCTLEPEENREVVEAFLEERPEFSPAPPEDEILDSDEVGWLDDRGWLEVLPQRADFDGAFGARLRRAG